MTKLQVSGISSILLAVAAPVALAGVTITVDSGSRVFVSAAPDGIPEDCQQSATIGPSGVSRSCSVTGASSRATISIQSTPGAGGLPTIVISADLNASITPPLGDAAMADMAFIAELDVTDRRVRYHLDYTPAFGGDHNGDSSGSTELQGHGLFTASASGVTDSLERDGTLDIGQHRLAIRVTLLAGSYLSGGLYLGESVFANGVMTLTFESDSEFDWIDPNGGDYADQYNWSPNGVPRQDTNFSDVANFPGSPANPPVTVTASATATAARWDIRGMNLRFQGPAVLGPLDPSDPAAELQISDGGTLVLQPGATVSSVISRIGVAGTGNESRLFVGGSGSRLTTTSLAVGDGAPGAVIVDQDGRMDGPPDIVVGRPGAAGTLRVESGGAIPDADSVTVGPGPGRIEIRGVGGDVSTLNVNALNVEGGGAGSALIEDGGLLDAGLMRIGVDLANGGEQVVVSGIHSPSGKRSTLSAARLAVLGGAGTQLDVRDGGSLLTTGVTAIGDGAATGKVIVRNTASGLPPFNPVTQTGGAFWRAASNIGIGSSGQPAELDVENGGVVIALNGIDPGSFGGETGRLTVSGDGAFVSARLRIGSDGRGEVNIRDGGRIQSVDAMVGDADPSSIGSGEVTVSGSLTSPANWDVTADLPVGAGGAAGVVKLVGTRIGPFNVGGATLTVGGTLTVGRNGSILGNGTLAVPPSRRVVNGGYIAPGLSPGIIVVEGDYEQTDAGVLEIEVAGAEPGQFDVLDVKGTVTLGGTLELHFIDGFVPPTDLSVPFLKVGGTLTGTFSNIIAKQDGEPSSTALETTLDENGQLYVRPVPSSPAAPDQAAPDPAAPACGAGLCGAGVMPMLPLTLLSLAGIKITRRRQRGPGRASRHRPSGSALPAAFRVRRFHGR